MSPGGVFVIQDGVRVEDIIWKSVCVTHFDDLSSIYLCG
jgi:hypothetical protein